MGMKWCYSHDGETLGPFSTAELKERAAAGTLRRDDMLWPEGADPHGAVAAADVLDWPAAPSPPPALPDWLDDIRAADAGVAPPTRSAGPDFPDWLADVRRAEGESVTPAPRPPKAADEVAAEFLLSEPPGADERVPVPAPPQGPPLAQPALPPRPGPQAAPAAAPTDPPDVALRRAMKEVHHWVDHDENRSLVLRGSMEAIRRDAGFQELLARYQGYDPELAHKLWQYLWFLVENRSALSIRFTAEDLEGRNQ